MNIVRHEPPQDSTQGAGYAPLHQGKDQDASRAASQRERTVSAKDEGMPADLQVIAELIAGSPPPYVSPTQTAHLLRRLMVEDTRYQQARGNRPWSGVVAVLHVARWRLRLLGAWFYVASVLLLATATLVTPLAGTHARALPFVLLIPLSGVLGLAHVLQPTSGGLRDVEACCPIGRVEAASGLVLTLAGLEGAFGVVATGVMSLVHWVSFAAFLTAWGAPFLLLTGISLPVAIRWGTRWALLMCGGPWLLLGVWVLFLPQLAGPATALFVLPHNLMSFTLHGIAALVGAALLVMPLLKGITSRASYEALLGT